MRFVFFTLFSLLLTATPAVQSQTSGITDAQTDSITAARLRRDSIVLGNRLDVEEKSGSSNNSITVEQVGNFNSIGGISNNTAVINGSSNTVNIKQGDIPAGRSLIELSVTGSTNNITIQQARNVTTGLQDGVESGGHYIGLTIAGNSNTATVKQGNEGTANSSHFAQVDISGSNNSMTVRQAANAEKRAFASIGGSNNTASIYQYATGNHYADLSLIGNGHTANITQGGTGHHRATVNLVNAGGASTVNLLQQGSTQQNYSIMQQCANLQGCSVSVTQGTP